MKKLLNILSFCYLTTSPFTFVTSCNFLSDLNYIEEKTKADVIALIKNKESIIDFDSKVIKSNTKEQYKNKGIKGDVSWFNNDEIKLIFKETKDKDSVDIEKIMESEEICNEGIYFGVYAKNGSSYFKLTCYFLYKDIVNSDVCIKRKTKKLYSKVIYIN